MKVHSGGKRSSSNQGVSLGGRGAGQPKAGDRVEGASFLEAMEEVERARLIEEIRSLGDSLSKHPSVSALQRYRHLIGLAIGMVRSTMALKRDYKWRRSERTLYVLIERTENALAELEAVLAGEGDRSRVLDLVEEIKGCLISILS
jgi:uncharacterized protein YaaR (DUF327 family)